MITLCRQHRLIWGNTICTCIKPCFPIAWLTFMYWVIMFVMSLYMCVLAAKTLGEGLSGGQQVSGDQGVSGELVGHHVSTDVNSWWGEQLFILEKCE